MHNKYKTHCKHGHEFTQDNTYIFKDGRRKCKICRKLSMRNDSYKGHLPNNGYSHYR